MAAPDTIVAIASAQGRGAVGVIRVSGARAPQFAAAMLGSLPPPRHAALSNFLGAGGEVLDRGIALYFPAPHSFTGEHVLELQAHGGPVVLDLIVKQLLALGCRAARPGEFSERAFLNGKIDIAQAEAVADLIDAGSAAAARAAVRSMQGEFSAQVQRLQAQITELRAYVEAAIDFPDEEVDFLSAPALSGRLAGIFAGFDAITRAARHGAVLREGMSVVIAGKPNAGKSSLLNRLAGDEVAIVTDVPGTTRDLLRQQIQLQGVPLNLIDTAGLRTAADVVEAEGVRRARGELAKADRILYVLDAGDAAPEAMTQLPAELSAWAQNVPITLVINKIDLLGIMPRLVETSMPPRVFLSAKSGAGIDLLREHLRACAGLEVSDTGAYSARRRHLDSLARARAAVDHAAEILASTRAFELFAEDLRLGQTALAEITGEFSSDDLLGTIFGSFCIGK